MVMSTLNTSGLPIDMPEPVEALMAKNISLISKDAAAFDFIDFFSGHTRAMGWFSDRFGTPKRHFSGDFHGSTVDSNFELREELSFTDGIVEKRLWTIDISSEGKFTAESDTLIGSANGTLHENMLRMTYKMQVLISRDKYWKLDMKDKMILQADGTVHNITHVYKWGIKIGTVSCVYVKLLD